MKMDQTKSLLTSFWLYTGRKVSISLIPQQASKLFCQRCWTVMEEEYT